jgi:hypothetical protein
MNTITKTFTTLSSYLTVAQEIGSTKVFPYLDTADNDLEFTLPIEFITNLDIIIDVNSKLEDKMGFKAEFDSLFKGSVCRLMNWKQENEGLVSQDGSTLFVDCEVDQLLSSSLETVSIFLGEQARKILEFSKTDMESIEILNTETMEFFYAYKNYMGTAYEYLTLTLGDMIDKRIETSKNSLYLEWFVTVIYLIIFVIRDFKFFIYKYKKSLSIVNKSLTLIPEVAYLQSEELLEEIFGETREKEITELFRKMRIRN